MVVVAFARWNCHGEWQQQQLLKALTAKTSGGSSFSKLDLP